MFTLTDRYYDFFYKLFNFKKFQCLFQIDFGQPWWRLLMHKKVRLAFVMIPQIVKRVASTLLPFILGQLFIAQRFDYFFCVLFVWMVILIFDYFSDFNFVQLLLSTQSIQYYAHQFLLKIDPIFHTTRETGKVIAKIERAVRAYRELIEISIQDLLFTFVGIITALVTLFYVDWWLGIATSTMIIIIVIVAWALYLLNYTAFFTRFINIEDTLKTIGLENLSQITLIRSAFAGNEANRRMRSQTQKSITV